MINGIMNAINAYNISVHNDGYKLISKTNPNTGFLVTQVGMSYLNDSDAVMINNVDHDKIMQLFNLCRDKLS